MPPLSPSTRTLSAVWNPNLWPPRRATTSHGRVWMFSCWTTTESESSTCASSEGFGRWRLSMCQVGELMVNCCCCCCCCSCHCSSSSCCCCWVIRFLLLLVTMFESRLILFCWPVISVWGCLVGVQVDRMGYVPAYGGKSSSRNVSCSKPSLHCRKRPWEGVLYKWLTKSASETKHMALYKYYLVENWK